MENYFILLELPFDPPEGNTDKILEAITRKQRYWSDNTNHPVHAPKFRGYLAKIEEIKKVMLDPESRKQEAEKAKQVKESKKKELQYRLNLYRNKSFTDKEIKLLVKNFGMYGYSVDEIKKLYDEMAKSDTPNH